MTWKTKARAAIVCSSACLRKEAEIASPKTGPGLLRQPESMAAVAWRLPEANTSQLTAVACRGADRFDMAVTRSESFPSRQPSFLRRTGRLLRLRMSQADNASRAAGRAQVRARAGIR